MGSTKILHQTILNFVKDLSKRKPTPGGGASSAVVAALGVSTSRMAMEYSRSYNDKGLMDNFCNSLDFEYLLDLADQDVKAYSNLREAWKKKEEKELIESQKFAQEIPTKLFEVCHQHINELYNDILKESRCNPNLESDLKCGIHQLAGAARSAYQIAIVNLPKHDDSATLKERQRFQKMLTEIQNIEYNILNKH